MQTKPRTPVVWLHGLECTCCTESFIRSYHPLAKDLVLSMVSLDYDDTIMAAAGHQAEEALEETIEKYKGNYIVAVEGNIPLGNDGTFCVPGGEIFLEKIKHVCKNAKAVIGWGSCASWGCVQTAKPNPTKSVPITEVITDKPVVLVPGCPPIPEVMTGVITYILTYDRLPPWTASVVRRCSTVSAFTISATAVHTLTRASSLRSLTTSAPSSATASIKSAARDRRRITPALRSAGTKVCPGPFSPVTAASAARKTTSLTRSFYKHEPDILPPMWGVESTVDKVGLATVAVVGVAAAAHIAMSAVSQARSKKNNKDLGEAK